jgi:hypothetical protein
MKRLLLVLAAGSLLAVPATGSAANHRKPCARPHTHTLAHNSVARVFAGPPRKGSDADKWLYGCLRSKDRKVPLDNAFDDGLTQSADFSHVVMRGSFVAWASSSTDNSCKAACPPAYEPTTYGVNVMGLRRHIGRGADLDQPAHRVLVSRHGAAVWSEGSGAERELFALEENAPRKLDAGDYSVSSIAITGDRVTWTHAGADMSSPLGHY